MVYTEAMTFKTHQTIAFAALATVAVIYYPNGLGPATIGVSLVSNAVGALLPDMDQASNRLWDWLPGGNFWGRILKNLFGSHRSITHSILGLILIYMMVGWVFSRLFNPEYINLMIATGALMIGYISHILADGLTEDGIPLLWPIKLRFGFPLIRSWRIKTGRWFEKWIILPIAVLYTIGLLTFNWKILMGMIG